MCISPEHGTSDFFRTRGNEEIRRRPDGYQVTDILTTVKIAAHCIMTIKIAHIIICAYAAITIITTVRAIRMTIISVTITKKNTLEAVQYITSCRSSSGTLRTAFYILLRRSTYNLR